MNILAMYAAFLFRVENRCNQSSNVFIKIYSWFYDWMVISWMYSITVNAVLSLLLITAAISIWVFVPAVCLLLYLNYKASLIKSNVEDKMTNVVQTKPLSGLEIAFVVLLYPFTVLLTLWILIPVGVVCSEFGII